MTGSAGGAPPARGARWDGLAVKVVPTQAQGCEQAEGQHDADEQAGGGADGGEAQEEPCDGGARPRASAEVHGGEDQVSPGDHAGRDGRGVRQGPQGGFGGRSSGPSGSCALTGCHVPILAGASSS